MDIAGNPAAEKPKSKITVARVVLWGIVVLGLVWFFAARQGKTVSGAIAGPTVLTDEKMQLKEGQWKAYELRLPSARKIDVHVNATPKDVDVMTISEKDYAQFSKAQKALFGGQFMYIPSLSSQKITKYDGSAVLAQGGWYIVVMRPKESMLFGDDTNASIKILGY